MEALSKVEVALTPLQDVNLRVNACVPVHSIVAATDQKIMTEIPLHTHCHFIRVVVGFVCALMCKMMVCLRRACVELFSKPDSVLVEV